MEKLTEIPFVYYQIKNKIKYKEEARIRIGLHNNHKRQGIQKGENTYYIGIQVLEVVMHSSPN